MLLYWISRLCMVYAIENFRESTNLEIYEIKLGLLSLLFGKQVALFLWPGNSSFSCSLNFNLKKLFSSEWRRYFCQTWRVHLTMNGWSTCFCIRANILRIQKTRIIDKWKKCKNRVTLVHSIITLTHWVQLI